LGKSVEFISIYAYNNRVIAVNRCITFMGTNTYIVLMKPNLIYVIVGTLMCTFFIACQKENEEKQPKYTDELYRTAIIKTAVLRMYTNHLEIKDTTIINRYVKNSLKYFNFDVTPYETDYRMKLVGTDSVAFMSGYNPYTFELSNGKYVFTSKVTVTRPFNDPLLLNIFKYQAPYVPYNISSSQVVYRTQDMRVGYGNRIEMLLPVVSYKFSSRTSNSFLTAQGFAFNEFDESVISKLGANDTLAVQLFNYDMKAKLIE
jgi:hypothetical protein